MTTGAPRVPTPEDAAAVLARFAVPGALVSLEPHTSGLINHSWVADVRGARAAVAATSSSRSTATSSTTPTR